MKRAGLAAATVLVVALGGCVSLRHPAHGGPPTAETQNAPTGLVSGGKRYANSEGQKRPSFRWSEDISTFAV